MAYAIIDDMGAEFESAAKELEDKIFAVNKPQPRRYLLKRVEE